MTRAPLAAGDHRVRAILGGGAIEAPCVDHDMAVALFDRLRRIAPNIRIERIAGTRVVEVAGLS
ncbi:hypothetical protein [Brevundimonas subvibrioides]|uniref:Uncharacterized protein n=1 Tax=Brevundimonas subvibrioides (strain ATCC 15264 / DSM 4735 / LMG 14903 / NBRC 16000 / CB 81) TaxID=633149 RepID=D9QIB1_BRESC|nr:hypothetical protein [Brevundimonas subvibrioides]ADK99413.1 hypothetical protein Bresu_0099 [Brevundimonas subvibrioides ATCC 15264]